MSAMKQRNFLGSADGAPDSPAPSHDGRTSASWGASPAHPSHTPSSPPPEDVFTSVDTDEIAEMGWSPKIKQSTAQLLMGLKRQLKKRGADGIAGIARKFRIMDDDNSGSLDIDEFTKAMKETKVRGLRPPLDSLRRSPSSLSLCR